MKIFYCDGFAFPLPPEHRFPLRKYTLLREQVSEAHLVPPGDMLVPPPAADTELLLAHDAGYLERVVTGALTPAEVRRIGLPWSPQLVERCRRAAGATVEACRAALADGVSVSLTGGTHHAFRDHGEGYCIFNDSVVAGRAMQAEGRLERVVIIDCDVHQGNGTAAILADDPSIFTYSIHCAKNFPFHKERSGLDTELPDHTGDDAYLEALLAGTGQALAQSRADLAIYLAGADPYAGDTLGRLSLTKDGLAARDRLVFELCWRAGVPVAVVMAGGYARVIQDTVDIQFATVTIAAEQAS
jgi:acetoin utilization deacetylase AcuC-like enzyme